MSKPKIDPSSFPKIVKLVTKDGVSQADVARRFGVSRKTINDIVKKASA